MSDISHKNKDGPVDRFDRFDRFYLGVAHDAANLSRAIRLKVGAVGVQGRNIIGFGFNGAPAGDPNECEFRVYAHTEDNPMEEYPYSDDVGPYRLVTKPSTLHAEENLILKIASSTNSTLGASLYCTHAPCIRCARMIHASGFRRLIYSTDYTDHSSSDPTPIHFLLSKGIVCDMITLNQN